MCVGLLSVITEYCYYDSNRVIIGIIIITLSFAGFLHSITSHFNCCDHTSPQSGVAASSFRVNTHHPRSDLVCIVIGLVYGSSSIQFVHILTYDSSDLLYASI